MRQRWTLNIRDFGKIEQASITMSPLMLFVGENNTGKSYVMSLLWGILKFGSRLYPQNPPESEKYKKCEKWLGKSLEKQSIGVKIDEDAQRLFLDWFNELLDQEKEKLVERVFNHKISIGFLNISDYKTDEEITFDLIRERKVLSVRFIGSGSNGWVYDRDIELYDIVRFICNVLFIDYKKDPFYLPASRTGFMLAYKTLLANMLDPNGLTLESNPEQFKSRFTLPVQRFLREIVDLEIDEESGYEEIATFLQQKILSGEITKDNLPLPNYYFRPRGSADEFPLYLTSSLVTELTPVILLLKSNSRFELLMIEEPEAHLHLQMQKVFTNAMVRLVNSGLPIWLTTHGDTVLQQVNNMIKLYHHPNGKEIGAKYGYEESDLLDPSKVTAYQFTVRADGKTQVDALQSSEFGFPVPTFNETIAELTKEAYEFQEFDDDAD